MVSSSNQKLQRKIERAIDRNKAKEANEGTGDKPAKRGRRKATMGAVPSKPEVRDEQAVASSKAVNGTKSGTPAIQPRAKDASSVESVAFAETELKEKSRLATSSKKDKTLLSGSHFMTNDVKGAEADKKSPKTMHTTRKATRRELSSTSQRAMKRVKTATTPSDQEQLRSQTALQTQAKNRTEIADSKKSNDSKKSKCNESKSNDSKKMNNNELNSNNLIINELNSENVDNSQAVPRRSSSALKVVFGLLAILCLVGVSYRWWNQMPDSVAPHAEEESIHAMGNDDEVLPDISHIALVERQTDTGRMTVIPRAEHWISTGNQKEISRQVLGAFAIDQVEVSHYQYDKCVAANACPPLSAVPDDLNMPVTHIGYGTAEAFCRFAGKQIPTAEQWEAAARFGGDTDGITHVNVTCETVHCGSDKGGECRKTNPPHPESVFRRMNGANPGHLLNMLGNVREWTSTEGKEKQMRVTKGGSYLTPKKSIQISAQEETRANEGAPDLGFRCVMLL